MNEGNERLLAAIYCYACGMYMNNPVHAEDGEWYHKWCLPRSEEYA